MNKRLWWLFLILGLAAYPAAADFSGGINSAGFKGGLGGWGGAAVNGAGTPLGPCGTGIIDLSTGCTLPIALGLVP